MKIPLKYWRFLVQDYKLLKLMFLFTLILIAYYMFVSDSTYKIEHQGQHDYELSLNFSFKRTSFETTRGYLVWNSKCHMLSMDPYNPSIRQFVKKEKFEACSTKPKLTRISRYSNGSIYLLVDENVAKIYEKLSCCWAAINRPKISPDRDKHIDSKISLGSCHDFKDRVLIDGDIDAVYASCISNKSKTIKIFEREVLYENVHAVINPERVSFRLPKHDELFQSNAVKKNNTTYRKPLSVFILGIDNVSRLNFYRTMPYTQAYFEEQGWIELRGYNKMGENTFPNLMAILTGQNQSWAYAKCKPQSLYGMDNCSMIWYNFRDAGYITAYAEDHAEISTFNYLKVGFVEPPTDYYSRPYILATEKLLKARKRFGSNYCTGPDLSVDRIFDYALDFSKAFIGLSNPYFGFFWTNTISHANVNGPSLYDTKFLYKLQQLSNVGLMNDSMIVVLSDHGMRYGNIRDTFVGWYEEKLPFIYIWIPEWFRKQNSESYTALRANQNRLTSPYDLYETLRDILQMAGGQAPASTGCPQCSTLFNPIPHERGCKDAGISPHWCACSTFEPYDMNDPIAIEGANKFIDHIENIVKQYKDERGNRLCSQPRLKRIVKVKKLLDLEQDPEDKKLKLFYLLEVTPGGGKFETTIKYNGMGNYMIRDEETSRINSYADSSTCLNKGFKQYCHCVSMWHSLFE